MVKLHEAQHTQAARFDGVSLAMRRLALKSTAASAAMTPLTQMLAAMSLSAVISVALWQNTNSGTSVGSFVAFVTAMLMLVAPIKHLSEIANPITRGLAALERGLDLIEHTPAEATGTFAPERVEGQLVFESVSVRYRDDERLALDRLSLRVAPGETVALVGPVRLRQDHVGEFAAAVCAAGRRTRVARRARPRGMAPRRFAAAICHGQPGRGHVQRYPGHERGAWPDCGS